MELTKPNYTERWVFPFPEEPETGIRMRKLNDAEVNRIYDKHKYIPGSKSATVARASAVLNDMICAAVSEWKGFTQDGVELPCSNENKLLMLDGTMLNDEGEKTTIWNIVNEKFAALQETDVKN